MCSLVLGFSVLGAAPSGQSEYMKEAFEGSDVCFMLLDIKSGKIVQQFNKERCAQKFDICSTFKLLLTSMAFDSRYFKSVDQSIQWDGKKRSRQSENNHQTPKTFMSDSVSWVGNRIIRDLGSDKVTDYLIRFGFGNVGINSSDGANEISHGLLKVSAEQQVNFLQKLWSGNAVSNEAFEKIKVVSETETNKNWRLYGKTGTGCIDKGCMNKPGRQLGWFVGVLENGKSQYAFAFNQSTKDPITGYAGPLTREKAIKFFLKFYN